MSKGQTEQEPKLWITGCPYHPPPLQRYWIHVTYFRHRILSANFPAIYHQLWLEDIMKETKMSSKTNPLRLIMRYLDLVMEKVPLYYFSSHMIICKCSVPEAPSCRPAYAHALLVPSFMVHGIKQPTWTPHLVPLTHTVRPSHQLLRPKIVLETSSIHK